MGSNKGEYVNFWCKKREDNRLYYLCDIMRGGHLLRVCVFKTSEDFKGLKGKEKV